jgi:hypothetical protein
VTRLRPLNLPVALTVQTGADGEPVAVTWQGRRRPVAQVLDRWRIDEGWWRAYPLARLYRLLALADGTLLTVFEDLQDGRWYHQRERFGPRPVRQSQS